MNPATPSSDALAFEHLVEVDDGQTIIPPVGLDRLWRGLLLRMEYPQNFQPGLERCDVLKLGPDEWLRTLDFGARLVRDRVRFDDQVHAIDIEVLGSVSGLQAQMKVQIETPQPQTLWVRFSYRVRSPDHSPESPLAGIVRDAWRQADEETIFRIRQLAASGVLDAEAS